MLNAQKNNIGILCPDRSFSENSFYSGLYRAVSQECAKAGLTALMELVPAQAEEEGTIPRLVADTQISALIFMGDFHRNYLEAVLRCGLPCILLDFYSEAVPQLDVVLSDNVQGGYELTRHLLENGCRTVYFVGSIFATTSIMDRYLGYQRAMLEAGFPLCPEWRIDDRDAQGKYTQIQLPEFVPDAFVCACDEVGLHLLNDLTQAGYRVPQDVSVVGYDDSDFSKISTPRMTAYRVNVTGMAIAAVRRIQDKLQGGESWHGSSVISGTLIPRESSGKSEKLSEKQGGEP